MVALCILLTLVTMILPSNVSAYDFQKSETQLHTCWCLSDAGYVCFSNTTSNALLARGSYSGGAYVFVYDSWSVFVTQTNGVTDNYAGPEQTLYYNQSDGQTTHVTLRTPVQVWIPTSWIKLASSEAHPMIVTGPHGYVQGVALGRFTLPGYYTPLYSIYFSPTTTINF